MDQNTLDDVRPQKNRQRPNQNQNHSLMSFVTHTLLMMANRGSNVRFRSRLRVLRANVIIFCRIPGALNGYDDPKMYDLMTRHTGKCLGRRVRGADVG
jgi:hypothetical protein